MKAQYDIIGDIHGHGQALIDLLEHLGYTKSKTGYQHPTRKVIFLGDFIDRGEHLRQHIQLLSVVMPMVDNGHALAVMGNHEFNALAFHTEHNDMPLRRHNVKNIKQHLAFLNEFESEPKLKQDVLDFFYRLPLWIELDGLRVVHACWDKNKIDILQKLTVNQCMTPELLIEANQPESPAYLAIETLLKGVEVNLPSGISFKDKDGHLRTAVRIAWWNSEATHLGEVVLPGNLDIGEASNHPLSPALPKYQKDERPCFIGHYWLKGTPKPLTENVACVDYSVAKDGKLVAYRWDGEQCLNADKFESII